jgi:hypothetical protein
MLRAIDSDHPHPSFAYRVPWRVDRIYDRHPLVTNTGPTPLDFVRIFVDLGRTSATEHWGQMLAGETAEICLCEADPDESIVTIAWFRPDDGEEYLWRFEM